MLQVKMFYIASDVEKDTNKVNEFLEELHKAKKKIKSIQVESNLMTGGDTVDTIMVVYDK